MKRGISLISGVVVCLAFFGCSKANHESTDLAQAQPSTNANTNALVISAENLERQINVAEARFTNAIGEIKEAAGAQASELRSLTDQFRSALQSDPAFSTNWQNIHLSVQRDKIILSGTVRSEAERQAVVTKAREIIGAEKFVDRLKVKPSGSATAPAPSSESQP